MLYLIATPIGNLGDITFRAIETLKACDYILCEDTRHSLPLLRHYDIHKPLMSYHKFNEESQIPQILDYLREGKQIGLISDAGTPGISDPGERLVLRCVEEGLSFSAIPGPCAAIQALTCSGFPTERFQFWGFLARQTSDLKQELRLILTYPGTTICYESPHRLIQTLELTSTLAPDHLVVVARELTKKFEEIKRGTAQELMAYWEKAPLKGEIVLIFSPKEKEILDWSQLTPHEHVEMMQNNYNLSLQEAIKMVAQLRHVPKREIYNTIHKNDENI